MIQTRTHARATLLYCACARACAIWPRRSGEAQHYRLKPPRAPPILPQATRLAQMLTQNSSLEELNLSYNPIGNEGAVELIKALRHNSSLSSLGSLSLSLSLTHTHTHTHTHTRTFSLAIGRTLYPSNRNTLILPI